VSFRNVLSIKVISVFVNFSKDGTKGFPEYRPFIKSKELEVRRFIN
jgi:hypothetical protein